MRNLYIRFDGRTRQKLRQRKKTLVTVDGTDSDDDGGRRRQQRHVVKRHSVWASFFSVYLIVMLLSAISITYSKTHPDNLRCSTLFMSSCEYESWHILCVCSSSLFILSSSHLFDSQLDFYPIFFIHQTYTLISSAIHFSHSCFVFFP